MAPERDFWVSMPTRHAGFDAVPVSWASWDHSQSIPLEKMSNPMYWWYFWATISRVMAKVWKSIRKFSEIFDFFMTCPRLDTENLRNLRKWHRILKSWKMKIRKSQNTSVRHKFEILTFALLAWQKFPTSVLTEKNQKVSFFGKNEFRFGTFSKSFQLDLGSFRAVLFVAAQLFWISTAPLPACAYNPTHRTALRSPIIIFMIRAREHLRSIANSVQTFKRS